MPQTPLPPDQYETDSWPQGDILDRALSTSLRAPDLPAGFRAALRGAIERDAKQDLLAQRRALEADRVRHLAELRAGYVRLQRNTLAMVLAAAFVAGAGATVVLPWFASTIGADVMLVVPLLGAMIGLGIYASVLVGRVGLPRWRPHEMGSERRR